MEINRIDGRYVINRDDGTEVSLTCNEVSLLVNYVGKEGLRSQIEDRVAFAIENYGLIMEKYEWSYEEFIDEIYTDLEDEIDCGNSVDDDTIDDKIADLGDYYDMYDDGSRD